MHFWGFGVSGLCRGTGRLQLLKSTVTEVPGDSLGRFWGGSGRFWEAQSEGTSRSLGDPDLRSAPPHTGSPGPFGPGTPEESGKSTPAQGPKRVRKSDFRLFSDSFDFWGPVPGCALSGLFSDSSGVPGPKGPGDPVWGGADRKP